MHKLREIIILLLFSSCLTAFSQPKYEYWDEDKKQLKSEEHFLKGVPHGKTASFYQSGAPIYACFS